MDNKPVRTEQIVIDGRRSERATFFDKDGNEVVELRTEVKPKMELDRRVISKKKEILAEQVIQKIQDGEVVEEEVYSVEPTPRLEKRDHVIVEYKSTEKDKTENEILTERIASLEMALKEARVPKKDESGFGPMFKTTNLSAQSAVEARVAEKVAGLNYELVIYIAIAAIQIAFLWWMVG